MEFRQIYPMLANKKDLQRLKVYESENWGCQKKYDGERVVTQIAHDDLFCTGRRTSTVTGQLSVKTPWVPHLHLGEQASLHFRGTTLDGEWMHPLGFQDGVSRITSCLPDNAMNLQKEIGFLHYYVYDILDYKGANVEGYSYTNRLALINQFFKELESINREALQYYHPVETVYSEEAKRALYQKELKDGQEGVIFRRMDAPYLQCPNNKRSNDLLKDKFEFEIDAVIMSLGQAEMHYTGKDKKSWKLWALPDGTGKVDLNRPHDASYWSYKGLTESGHVPVSYTWFNDLYDVVNFGCYRDGKLEYRGSCSGFTYETAYAMKDNPTSYIGQACEIKCYGFMKSGKLRHPQWKRLRNDKNPEDCLW